MENTIAVRVPDDVYARLREMAAAEDRQVSYVVRRLLAEALKPAEVKA
jgi:predicted transcriptional regulator